MRPILLDTHVFVWTLTGDSRHASCLHDLIAGATAVFVAPCSFYEIAQKHRLGKFPEIDRHIDQLPLLLEAQGSLAAPFTARIAQLAGGMDWAHRDPFDRMIAATALDLGCPLVSKDAAFDDLAALPGWKGRLWA